MPDLPTGTVTFLYTDIEGSTALWQQHPLAMPAVIARHDALLKEIIAAHGGMVFRTVGDAVHAAFGTPNDAVAAALAAQRALAAEPWPEGIVIRVRMGIHTGAVEIQGEEYAGHTLNRVARIMAAGHGGQILLSSATAQLVRESPPRNAALKDLGEHHLRDLLIPERIYGLQASGLPTDFPPLKTLDKPQTNLPVRRGGLVGRDSEIEAAKALLTRDDVGLVTFTGPGGMGKTSLAIAVGHALLNRFPDGVWFVPLAPIIDPALVPSAMMSTLGLHQEPGRSSIQTLRDFLASKQTLLVLDNLEQVIGVAPDIAELLQCAPQLTVLATSRIPLHLREERELPIAPLSLPDHQHLQRSRLSQYGAVQLFMARAQGVRPDFAITAENAAAVAEICARLDGLPLAIELAAARIRVLTPQALLRRLERRLPLLTSGAHDLPERQQTMEAAIAWSYGLLTPEEQTLYRRLSVFAGGFTLEVAEEVCSMGDEATDLLDGVTSLVDKSLIRQEDVGGEPRFSMLQTIREYGLERLAECGEAEMLHRRHATYYTDAAVTWERLAFTVGAATVMERFGSERDNFRAALDWCVGDSGDTEMGLRLVGQLVTHWGFGGDTAEGRARVQTLLACPDAERYPEAWAEAMRTLGMLEQQGSESARALEHLHKSEEILRRRGETAGLAEALSWMGMAAGSLGDWDNALRWLRESHELSHAAGLRWAEATGLGLIAEFSIAHGDLDEVRALAEASLEGAQALHDGWGMARMEGFLAGIDWMAGDLASAHARCEKAIALLRDVGEFWNLSRQLTRMGIILLDEQRYEDAENMLIEGIVSWQRIGNNNGVTLCLAAVVAVAALRGQAERARRLYAAEPFHRAERIGLDGTSDREYEHVRSIIRAELGDMPGTAVIPLDDAVDEALQTYSE